MAAMNWGLGDPKNEKTSKIKINFASKYSGKRATVELGTYNFKNDKWTIRILGSVTLNKLGDATYKSKWVVLKGNLIRVKIGTKILGRAAFK